ncbi:MAG: hypothetical protein LBQ51_09595 [Desulfovibrio sp.]|jgi:hypothetical protein|nr:hypothetical protein [Desulfovibrio sp.]
MPFFDALSQYDIQADEFLIFPALFGTGAFFLLAFLCGGLPALRAESTYLRQNKAFYDKYALQFSQALLLAGLAALLFLLLNAALFLPRCPDPPSLCDIFNPRRLKFFVPALLCILSPALSLLYTGTWPALRRQRAIHLLIGLSALLTGLLLFCLLTLLFLFIQHPYISLLLDENPGAALPAMLEEFAGNAILWPPVLYLFFTGLAAASALVRLWLILRRNRADYGRDYYAFAARASARSALIFTIAATVAGALLFSSLSASTAPEFRQTPEAGILLAACALPILGCLLHLAGVLAANPMRRKAGAFGACLLQLTAFCTQLTLFINTYPAA